MCITGILLLAYLWKVLGDRGLYADATGTGGYTTVVEIIIGMLGVLLLVGSVIVLMRAINKKV
jgi:hypothetical protein